ncbi:hypothetical protein, partial [Weissella confusa]|uniref:hypothetical protein n=2 Tax=Weissella confusa TaxID=1583 RepID=UPI0011029FAC
RVFWADWLQLVCPFLFLHPKTKKGTNNQSRERVVISTKYFRTFLFIAVSIGLAMQRMNQMLKNAISA